MKKSLIFLLFFTTCLLLGGSYEIELYTNIFPMIFHKHKVKIYTNKKYIKLFEDSNVFIIVDDCNKSDIVFGDFSKNVCCNIPHFETSYKRFKSSHCAIGAFYWRKGRPQLRFKTDTLKRYGLILPDKLKKYILE